MILLAAAALVGGLIQEPELTVLSVPPGSNRPFAEAVSAIVDDLKAERFEEAAQKAAVLPDRSIRVQWDDSKVDASHGSLLIRGREKALEAWERVNQKLEITYVEEDPDILIGFVEKLHKDPETGDQIGAVHFTSYSPLEPRIESVIGLKRGPKLLSIDSIDIANEFAYAIGRYMGLERRPRPGSSMFRQETDYRVPPIVGRDEIMTFVACLELTDQLREAAAKKNRHFQLGQPRAFVDIKSLEGGTVNQGESMPMSFVVTNSGDAPLVYWVLPDCSCFTLSYTSVVPPGASRTVKIDIKTMDFPGPVDKALYLYTNDPNSEVKRIPVTGNVLHAYRILKSEPGMVHVSNGQDEVIDLYFTVPKDSPMKLEGMTTQGLKADVQWEPWTGRMADPLLNEGPIERRGWKIQIFIAKPTLVGRLPFSLMIKTDQKGFDRIPYSLTIQNGIIADPGSLNLGQIQKQAARGAFFITRPERPFQITKLEQDSEFIKAFIEDIGEDDRYKVIVDLSADAPFGMFRSYVTVHTTDPQQPTILVPVRAIIQ